MLCFVFAALVVILDQFFKHWIVLTVELQGKMDFIPGILELTHEQNSGAAFSILSNQRWLLAGISFFAAILLVFILMRYTEGFWGSLGLSAVLGGTVGNLIDRVFQGYVVDMFKPQFMTFAIFNIADIFLTLGFLTFIIHFIISSVKANKREQELEEAPAAEEEAAGDEYSMYDVPEGSDIPDFDEFSVSGGVRAPVNTPRSSGLPEGFDPDLVQPGLDQPPEGFDPDLVQQGIDQLPEGFDPDLVQQGIDQPLAPDVPNDIASALDALKALESELGSMKDYDADDLLRKYGFEDKTNDET